MHSSKLFDILRKLSASEWKGLKKFTQIHYTENADQHRLFMHIYKYRNELDHKHLEAEYCWQKLFPKLKEKSFRNLLSRLQPVVEDYLVWEQIKKDKNQYRIQLFEAYDDRGIDKYADKIADDIRIDLSSSDHILDAHDLLILHRINHSQYYSDNPIKYKRGQEILTGAMESIHRVYEILRRLYETEMYSMSQIKNENWLSDWRKKLDSQDPCISTQIAQALYELKTEPSHAKYEYLRDKLYKHSLSKEMSQLVLAYLLHFLAVLNRKGELIQERLDLIVYGLEKNTLLDKGTINPMRYNAIIDIACHDGRIEWAKAFAYKWAEYLPEKERDDVLHLGQILILFAESKYDECLHYFMSHPIKAAKIDSVARRYYLQCIYELYDRSDPFLIEEVNKTAAHLRYNKDKLSRKHYSNMSDFLQAYRILLRGKTSELSEALDSGKVRFAKKWIEKKLEQIAPA